MEPRKDLPENIYVADAAGTARSVGRVGLWGGSGLAFGHELSQIVLEGHVRHSDTN
jgi:hypothetical protein